MRYDARISDLARAGLALVAGLTLGACESLLDVQSPSRVPEETLKKPSNAKVLVDGARAAFGCALQAYINGGALLSDEMEDTQLGAAAWPWDRRDWTGALGNAYAEATCTAFQAFGVYRPLQTARFAADEAVQAITAFPDTEVVNKPRLLADANLLLGYSRLLLGEGFCSAAERLGPELFPQDFFARGEASFGESILRAQAALNAATTRADSTAATAINNAALVGRARARLNLARLPGQPIDPAKYADARSDAMLVPSGFVYNIVYSDAPTPVFARNNLVQRNRLSLNNSVAPTYRNLTDPRVRVTQGVRGADAVSTVWYADKYPTLNTPIPLASWKESQLIIAEAELAAGSVTNAIAVLDALRGRTGVGLPPYSGPVDPDSVQAFLITERAKELFLEGQHFWDINRFNLPLDPPAGAPYPIKGGTYADLRCLPLPDIERINNPNLSR